MNNTRIRYLKTAQGVLQSRRYFMTGANQEVYVQLDLNAKTYRILESASGVEVASGSGTINISVLKIKAKRMLLELGVNFSDEKRNREKNSETTTLV